jgi:simple sugar transport system permease protein
MLIIWALVLVAFGHISCSPAPQFGNWIFASGGDAESARNVGRSGQPRQEC